MTYNQFYEANLRKLDEVAFPDGVLNIQFSGGMARVQFVGGERPSASPFGGESVHFG